MSRDFSWFLRWFLSLKISRYLVLSGQKIVRYLVLKVSWNRPPKTRFSGRFTRGIQKISSNPKCSLKLIFIEYQATIFRKFAQNFLKQRVRPRVLVLLARKFVSLHYLGLNLKICLVLNIYFSVMSNTRGWVYDRVTWIILAQVWKILIPEEKFSRFRLKVLLEEFYH